MSTYLKKKAIIIPLNRAKFQLESIF